MPHLEYEKMHPEATRRDVTHSRRKVACRASPSKHAPFSSQGSHTYGSRFRKRVLNKVAEIRQRGNAGNANVSRETFAKTIAPHFRRKSFSKEGEATATRNQTTQPGTDRRNTARISTTSANRRSADRHSPAQIDAVRHESTTQRESASETKTAERECFT